MIDPIDYSVVVAAQADINETVLRLFENQQSRIEFLEAELSAIQESLAYVEAGK